METEGPGQIPSKGESVEQGPAKTQLGLGTVFRYSGLLGAQLYQFFSMLTCSQEASCSSTGFASWLLNPDSFIHPYSWYHSWTKYPDGFWYVAAPYGYPWYVLNSPAILGYLPWAFWLLTVDTIANFLVVKYRGWKMIVPFMLSSQFFLNYDPVDLFPFLLSVAGTINPAFSVAALLVKLPIGAPGYVWNFILHSPVSIGYAWNWGRYAWLAAWWLTGILLYIQRRKQKAQLGKISID